MSEIRRFDGIARVTQIAPPAMLTLRLNLSDAGLTDPVQAVTGLDLPGPRQITQAGDRSLGWMAPDEALLICPWGEGAALQSALTDALAGLFATVVDVSDARAVFTLSGPHAREVLAKLAPVDLHPDQFGPGEIRRTRIAQAAAAFWMTGPETFQLIAFRSVADYVFALVSDAAAPGGEVGLFSSG